MNSEYKNPHPDPHNRLNTEKQTKSLLLFCKEDILLLFPVWVIGHIKELR